MATSIKPTYRDVRVSFTGSTSSGDANVHYVSAGDPSLPTIVLLHGFPSSSYQYREFMPLLADSYHVVAPDLPGFGLTTVSEDFQYTFDNLAAVISAWLAQVDITSFAVYIFDYGAPVGLRIASQQATKGSVKAIITQNGNAYEEGFGQDFWRPIFSLWKSSNSTSVREVTAENVLTLATTKFQYTEGTPEKDLPLLNPSSWHFDFLQNIAGKKNIDHQLDLFFDYRKNVEQYPTFHRYFRDSQVPILAVWGRGDPAFIPSGAEAFRKDSPNVVVKFVDAGHFALETKRWEVAKVIREWLQGIGY